MHYKFTFSELKSLSVPVSFKHNQKKFQKLNLEKQNNFLVYGKIVVTRCLYMEKHGDFIRFSVRIELYGTV